MKKSYSLIKMALLLAVFLGFTDLKAQNAVTGTVTSATDNSGLPGISVLVKGTSTGTSTDPDGKYRLVNVPDNATLVFSFIGFLPQEIPVGNRTTIDVALAEDVQKLSEIVVVGYGTAKRKDVTGAVTQVSARDLNAGIQTNPLQSLQGKVSGLVITTPNGDPNQSPTVRLRGYTSLAGGSDPLYVVDGVIGVPINSVSPSDIETIDVLKDASASAIYGSRAANGVIIVTTRRGKDGKTSISFNNYVGIENISNRLELLDGAGYRAQVSRIKGEASLSDNIRFPTDANGNGYSTDWVEEITRTGYTNNHDLALTGGGPNFSYRGSLNYISREGIVRNTGFNRVTGRFNVDQKALDNRLSVQYNLSLSSANSKLANDGLLIGATNFLPTLPVRDDSTGGYAEVAGSFDLFNPVAALENYKNDRVTRVLIGAVNLKYEVLDGLILGVNGAYRNENEINSLAFNRAIKAFAGNQGNTSRQLRQTNNKLLELTASYTKGFGTTGSNFNVLGGYSYQDNVDDGFYGQNNNYIDGGYNLFGYDNLGRGRGTLLSGRSDYVGSYKNEYTLISFFGRATLNLMDRYNFTATVRRDGSSKFGANNKWGVFPSFAAGWTISDEAFLKGSAVLNNLKLRAGWGQTGNSEAISPYRSLRLYGPTRNYYDGSIGDYVPGYGYIQNANPDLRWEVIEQTNVGLDFSLFNRLTGTIEVYNKDTKNMLYPYTVPADGINYVVNTIIANVGQNNNKGIELSLGGDVIQKADFTWNARLVGQINKNKITSLTSDQFSVGVIRYNNFGGRGLSNVFASRLQEGRPLGEFVIPHFVGFDTDGKLLLEGEEAGTTTSDYTKAKLSGKGNGQPQVTGSIINNFRYKNFDLYFQFRGVFTNKILNNLRSNLTIPGSILETNMLEAVADFPTNYSANQLSDLWLESGAFVRLDNWQIGYNIPVTGSKVFQNARVYVGGNNLFIFTKYKGIDPELEVKGDLRDNGNSQEPNSIGLDNNGIYPKTRSFLLGVNLTF
ncbi:MAG: TonB-dependent receptor [Ferruginibacter sp.]|nr:TonB-dependent receptor [Cytophagales bacterium]